VRRTSIALAVCVAAFAVTSNAHAETLGGCGATMDAWLLACSVETGVTMRTDYCANEVAVVAASADGEVVRVELNRANPQRSFARADRLGVSPIGEFTDWSAAPAGVRRGFEAVQRCATERVPTWVETPEAAVVARYQSTPTPWRSALAALTLLSWLVLVIRAAPRATRLPEISWGTGATVFVAALRRVTIEPGFFNQNAHGPGWVQMALCRPSDYGPGYASLFHGAASYAGVWAERGVFAAQECLAALAVGAVYVIARGAAVPRRVAFAVAIAVGIQPLLGRLARSESYFAASLWLLLLAVAALSVSGPRARVRDPRLIGGALIAGVLIAIAGTVHPVAWVPCAFAPVALMLRLGTRRQRLTVALLGTTIIGIVVAVVALPAMLDVMHGSLGRQWGSAGRNTSRMVAIVATMTTPWLATALLPRRVAAWVFPAAILLMIPIADHFVNMFGSRSQLPPAEAWRMLFRVTSLAAAVPLIARVSSRARRFTRAPSVIAALIVLLGSVVCACTWREWTTLPTDALEARTFGPILRSLPPTRTVFFLGSSGMMADDLPLYQECTRGSAARASMTAGASPSRIAPGDYWFHAATCSTKIGRPYCDGIESHLVLRPLLITRLPARQSLEYLPYDRSEVVSALYHVEAIRE
jgi:hypothetical protein